MQEFTTKLVKQVRVLDNTRYMNKSSGTAIFIILITAIVLSVAGVYFTKSLKISGSASSTPTQNEKSPIEPTNNISENILISGNAVTLTVRETSFGNNEGSQPVVKTQDMRVSEGQSFYFNKVLKPIITKPVFKLEKINSTQEVQLSYSNEVAFTVNDKIVANAPRAITLKKGNTTCFVSLWEDKGYKFCVEFK